MSAYRGGVPVARLVRSGFEEGVHYGSVAVVDGAGTLIRSAGDPRGPIFPRSSNKPMQALAALRSGLVAAELPDPADLALIAASHSGEPEHVSRVLAMLERGGLTEDNLGCPPDLPIYDPARTAILRAGGGPRRVYMNCSGKHTGMLLACRAAGWPIEDVDGVDQRDNYLSPDHPLQVACRAAVEDLSGETVAAIGVDGCGAPVMAISLTGLARAFSRLVAAAEGTPERAVADAMRARPDLVSGTGREDLALMTGWPGLLSKGGAEGVAVAAIPGVGAVAMKIDDGAARARVPVLLGALRELGIDVPISTELAESPVYGGGRVVGSVAVVSPLLR